jgi:asparagine synthase (glutamine-hydrolysing)
MRMLETLRHEPFYVTGTFIDESLGLYIGWAARKDSFADGMPIRNEQGDIAIVFAGEDYPALDTARDLKKRGHDCALEGPSYLVHSYEEDPDFFKNLNGRFHGVVADCKRGTATLFNDRFGLQRVCFHAAKEAFYFAAEGCTREEGGLLRTTRMGAAGTSR